ncbi:hypothetical protein [Kingella potus]|uniref:hypothetical protein n=1 Tax=Kingella potus TaxID=265175 RepID=UPI001FD579F9|nr:hypothetical protein [Kingella potus]UOP02025.1 hypothetical protein LVJ84_14320 [Kingella potus]
MQLKRKDTGEILALPDDMQWQDEMEWSAVAQAAPQRTLSGGLVIQQGVKQNGRPVTLSGDWAWHRRADLLRLRGWSDTAGLIMTLTLPDVPQFRYCLPSARQAVRQGGGGGLPHPRNGRHALSGNN